MKRIPRVAAAVLLLVGVVAAGALGAAGAAAQSLTTGALGGVVETPLGTPLAEVQVTVTPVGGGLSLLAETDRDGRFLLPLVPPGDYEVLAERLGYGPVVVGPVPVRVDRRADVRVELERAEGVVAEPARRPFDGAGVAAGSRPGRSQYFGDWSLGELPERDTEARDLLAYSTLGERSLEMEGLPGSMGALAVEGIVVAPLTYGLTGADPLGETFLPIRALDGAEVMAGRPDAEWAGVAGGVLATTLRRGSGAGWGDVQGVWSGGPMAVEDAPADDPSAEDPSLIRVGGIAGGSFLADSARGWAFGEYQRRSVPVRAWPLGRDDLRDDLATAGLDAGDATPVNETERVSLGGSFDWRASERWSVRLFSLYGQGTQPRAPSSLTGLAAAVTLEGSDLVVGGTATGQVGASTAAEFRVAYRGSSRDYTSGGLGLSGLTDVTTALFPAAAGQLGDPAYPATLDRSDLTGHATLFIRGGDHLLETGVGGRLTSHDRTAVYGGGVALFNDLGGYQQRVGVLRGLEGASSEASFSVAEIALYGQDTWRAAPGLDLTTGVRFEGETLPAGDLLANRRWLALTGVDNTAVESFAWDVGLAAGFDWDVQERHEWRVRGALAIQQGDAAADLLAEALTHDGRLQATISVGDLTETVDAGPRLTILSPGYEPPLTTRASFGISRALGPSAVAHVGAVVRQTDRLPRRTDLNRAPAAPFRDAYGRPVYGRLVREGGLLVAAPNSNRRFAEFDAVSAIVADGSSQYWGVTAGLEKREGPLRALVSYTFSSTEDDWLGAAGGDPLAALSPFAGDPELEGWADGTSDFDVPHRFTAAAELAVPFAPALRLGGSFRYASGRPFTPGFGPGIDANGDGVAGNDPAFIDADLEGMDGVFQEWSCLRQESGRFVERNACRGDDRTLLDAWAAVRLPLPGFAPELRVEALALSHGGGDLIDTALYRLDPSGELVVNEATGRVTVPLAVNPRFGTPLQNNPELTRIRISLRMVF